MTWNLMASNIFEIERFFNSYKNKTDTFLGAENRIYRINLYVKKKIARCPLTRHSCILTKYYQLTIVISILTSTEYSELEIKENTKSASSFSYLDMLLEKDISGNLTTKLSNKLGDFNFS